MATVVQRNETYASLCEDGVMYGRSCIAPLQSLTRAFLSLLSYPPWGLKMVECGWVDISKSWWIDWVGLSHTTTPSCFVTYHFGLKVGPIAAGPCIHTIRNTKNQSGTISLQLESRHSILSLRLVFQLISKLQTWKAYHIEF